MIQPNYPEVVHYPGYSFSAEFLVMEPGATFTLVRHAFVVKQNKSAVHVSYTAQMLLIDVQEDSSYQRQNDVALRSERLHPPREGFGLAATHVKTSEPAQYQLQL